LEKKTTFFQINKEMKVLESGPQGWHKLAKQCLSLFNQNVFDELYFIYPNFINALVQQPSIEKVLPMDMAEQTLLNEKKTPSSGFIYEPNKKSVIDSFLQARYENSLVRILLSSVVSEHAARMTAMDNATNNANKVIKDLTLQYNRARQAAITKELIEITSGAEAI
jgi:F-type H+-transporting ATPase subunit gamma